MANQRKRGTGGGSSSEADSLMEKNVEYVEPGGNDVGGDGGNIALLLLLYVLQGIPLGLAASIPMILQHRHVSYKDQATFSLSFWPFSIKLLWAPLVDSVYLESVGRRKSWLVPAQYLIGGFMLLLSMKTNMLFGDDDPTVPPNVPIITSVFFALNFLAATQDIAVDGWALTILSRPATLEPPKWYKQGESAGHVRKHRKGCAGENSASCGTPPMLSNISQVLLKNDHLLSANNQTQENVGWASTCNSVGQTAGYFLGFVVFLALESQDFCINYLGQPDSLVTLSGFLYFWGVVFCLTTTGVWLFKSEARVGKVDEKSADPDFGLVGTYKILGTIVTKPIMTSLIAVLLTCKIGFAAADSLTALKLTEYGVPKDRLALLSIPLTPVQIFLPLYISRHTSGPRPLSPFMYGYIFRLVFGLALAGLVWYTPYFRLDDGSYPFHYYLIIVIIYLVHQVFVNCMFVGVMAFFARISDSTVGGTYMTLLNTFTNLGGNWPSWVALRFVSELTWTSCLPAATVENMEEQLHLPATCYSEKDRQMCEGGGGVCEVLMDGYYIESAVLVVVGLLWARWGLPTVRRLQELPVSAWAVKYQRTQ